jgi:uncharacterized repeat protein (TIGR01451 family)/LPXTG-motif cell wall-anchored protein
MHAWEYWYNGALEFTLRVVRVAVSAIPGGYADQFIVDLRGQAPGKFLYGKSFLITPHIYFDQSLIGFPAEGGTLDFSNTASYAGTTFTHNTTHTYSSLTSSGKLSNMNKTVDKETAAPGDVLRYSLTFGKKGALPIAAGMFWANDRIDPNLAFVEGSIKISVKNAADADYTPVSTAVSGTEAKTPCGAGDALGLNVKYIGDADPRVYISNFDAISLDPAATVKVEFDARVQEDARGESVLNSFGGVTVETPIDPDDEEETESEWDDDDNHNDVHTPYHGRPRDDSFMPNAFLFVPTIPLPDEEVPLGELPQTGGAAGYAAGLLLTALGLYLLRKR